MLHAFLIGQSSGGEGDLTEFGVIRPTNTEDYLILARGMIRLEIIKTCRVVDDLTVPLLRCSLLLAFENIDLKGLVLGQAPPSSGKLVPINRIRLHDQETMPAVARGWHKIRRDAALADLNRSIVQPHDILNDNMGQDGVQIVVVFESNA